jgi:hypothetical protein
MLPLTLIGLATLIGILRTAEWTAERSEPIHSPLLIVWVNIWVILAFVGGTFFLSSKPVLAPLLASLAAVIAICILALALAFFVRRLWGKLTKDKLFIFLLISLWLLSISALMGWLFHSFPIAVWALLAYAPAPLGIVFQVSRLPGEQEPKLFL